ncbi:MAG: DUF1501 domain-containing protein [Akkermansiaceae bacterium]
MNSSSPFSDEFSRREFLRDASRKFLGVSLAPMLGGTLASQASGKTISPSKSGTATNVIFLNMAGGMSHLDTFDLKPGQDVQGPVKGIPTTADGLQIASYLPQTAKIMNEVCTIHSMQSKQGDHEQASYLLHKGYNQLGTIVHPALGSWVTRLKGTKNDTLPGYIAVNSPANMIGAGWMGAKFAPAVVTNPEKGLEGTTRHSSVSEADFERRLTLADAINKRFHRENPSPNAKNFDTLFDEAVRVMKSEDLAAFDLTKEAPALRDRYGRHSFGQGCLLARRLVEHGVRFIEVTLGDWDTHYDNFTGVQARCQLLDSAYATLISDLKECGLLQSTLVVLTSEFGRTPEIQKEHRNGRSHHPGAFTNLLAGGGVQGGITYGKTDEHARAVTENPVTFHDLNSTIAYSLGIDHTKVLHSPSKRPFRMAGPDKEDAGPITSIFS